MEKLNKTLEQVKTNSKPIASSWMEKLNKTLEQVKTNSKPIAAKALEVKQQIPTIASSWMEKLTKANQEINTNKSKEVQSSTEQPIGLFDKITKNFEKVAQPFISALNKTKQISTPQQQENTLIQTSENEIINNPVIKSKTSAKRKRKSKKQNDSLLEDEKLEENEGSPVIKRKRLSKKKDEPSSESETSVNNNSSVIKNISKLPTENTKGSLLEKEEEKPQVTLFGGFTEEGLQELKDNIPDIVKAGFGETIEIIKAIAEKGFNVEVNVDDTKQESLLSRMLPKGLLSGLGVVVAGGAMVLGGLAALVKGLSTDGPFKGLLKILSQGGILGGIKLIEVGAKSFMTALKALARSPFSIMRLLSRKINGVFKMFTSFGSELSKMFSGGISMITKILPKTGIFGAITKAIGSVFSKILSKGLNFIPFIGPAISMGFAVSRLFKGDIIGGMIDLASAVISFIPGIGPTVALAISSGLSVLNMILDFKGGGAKPGATEKKGNILLGWLKGLGNLVLKGVMMLPIIGPGIKAVKAMMANQYGEGLKQLAYMVPGVELIGALFGDKSASSLAMGAAGAIKGTAGFLGKVALWVGKMIYKGIKTLPIIGPAIKAVESFVGGQFLRGLKQLAYIIPGMELIGGLFGDKDAGALGAVGGVIRGTGKWLAGFTGWVFKKIYAGIKQLPVIGPVFKAIENFTSGNFLKGLKQLAYIFPPFEMLGGLLGDKEVGGVAKIGSTVVGWMGNLAKWA